MSYPKKTITSLDEVTEANVTYKFPTGDKWVRIPETKEGNQLQVIRYRGLQNQLNDLAEMRSFTKSPERLKAIEAQEKTIRTEMQQIESSIKKPAGAVPVTQPKIRRYNSATGTIE